MLGGSDSSGDCHKDDEMCILRFYWLRVEMGRDPDPSEKSDESGTVFGWRLSQLYMTYFTLHKGSGFFNYHLHRVRLISCRVLTVFFFLFVHHGLVYSCVESIFLWLIKKEGYTVLWGESWVSNHGYQVEKYYTFWCENCYIFFLLEKYFFFPKNCRSFFEGITVFPSYTFKCRP